MHNISMTLLNNGHHVYAHLIIQQPMISKISTQVLHFALAQPDVALA